MANPASQNCVNQGGTLTIEERGDGGQFGVCTFEDNLQCEEWALLRGDLVAMALAMWLPNPAANCPKDQPIAECQVTPSQQLYTITLDTAQTVK